MKQLYPFLMLLGFGYAGYTLNENGETLATIILAVCTFLWLLERHNVAENNSREK